MTRQLLCGLSYLLTVAIRPVTAQGADQAVSVRVNAKEYFAAFTRDSLDRWLPGDKEYRLRVCADVPDDLHPERPAYHRETGHVFCIVEVFGKTDTMTRVFGFYPRFGLPTLAFRKTKSCLKDNSGRVYDVEICLGLTAGQFDSVVQLALSRAGRRYHLNKYNCYDYAMELFNTVSVQDPLPVTYTRFPFPFGRGGSPCSVFRDCKRMLAAGGAHASRIRFGTMRAPKSDTDLHN